MAWAAVTLGTAGDSLYPLDWREESVMISVPHGPLQLETLFFTQLLEVSLGKDFGLSKGVKAEPSEITGVVMVLTSNSLGSESREMVVVLVLLQRLFPVKTC